MKTILINRDPDKIVVSWIKSLFPGARIVTLESVSSADSVDLSIIEARIDINPGMYNQQIGQRTCISPRSDIIFDHLFRTIKYSKENRIPVLSIGSAAQYVAVLSNASLIQHVENHSHFDGHKVSFITGEDFIVPTTHHQLIDPRSLHSKFEVIARTSPKVGEGYMDQWDNLVECPIDIEAFLLTDGKIKYLGLQFHPEVMEIEHPFNKYLKEFLIPELSQKIVTSNENSKKALDSEKSDKYPNTPDQSYMYKSRPVWQNTQRSPSSAEAFYQQMGSGIAFSAYIDEAENSTETANITSFQIYEGKKRDLSQILEQRKILLKSKQDK